MKAFVSLFVLTLVSVNLSGALEQTNGLATNKQQQQLSTDRQGRSLSNVSNNNLSQNNNIIEHSSSKARYEEERRQVSEFLNTKTIFKSIMKLLFGNQEEIKSTSRTVMSHFAKVLHLLKASFGQKSRSGSGRTMRDSVEEAANAGVTMLQGYVKSVITDDEKCRQRFLCEASRDAARESKELGYIIASVGGYATSYLLDSSRPEDPGHFKKLYEASVKGRMRSEESCEQLYPGTCKLD